MMARSAERPESGQGRVGNGSARNEARGSIAQRVLRAEHGLAQIFVGRRIAGVIVRQELIAQGLLRPAE